ncbi:hypothetical protein HY745_11245, partial [Candidatus Desantisbacteria bacterium]|nr:hypothetical protein [Candidatus Desantisbacteria bacterium]
TAGNALAQNYNWSFTTGTATNTVDGTGKAKKGCIITTITYGSSLNTCIKTLTEFKDRYLFKNSIGEFVTEIYYKVSPSITEFIY